MLLSGHIYAILTGILFGLQGAFGKKLTANLPPLFVAWGASALSLPYLLLLLIIDGIPPIIWKEFLWSTSLSFSINSFAWYFFFRALQKSSLSHTMPFTAFTPLFLIPVAFLILGELPDIKGIMGILCVFTGGYIIHLETGRILSPVLNLRRNPGTRLILLVALLWSVTATAEKVAVLSSSQLFYGSVIGFMLTLVYLPFLYRHFKSGFRLTQKNWGELLILGLISGLTLLFQFTALKYLLVSYVISFKRAGVIISVLIGVLLYREKNAIKNIISTLIMIMGVFLILL